MQNHRREELEIWARSQSYDEAFADQAFTHRTLDDQRRNNIPQVESSGENNKLSLTPVSDDASFRRYFRWTGNQPGCGIPGFILVDAPPAQENNESFIKISQALLDQGLTCPRVLAADLSKGFLLVTDLGDASYLKVITEHPDRVARLYEDAVKSLLVMQDVKCELPAFDDTLLRAEMTLFPEWFLEQQLQMAVPGKLLRRVNDLLVKNALAQPQVFVHRDYHSRNLMVVTGDGPGILDFQDAVTGPITYDLVSLFKDCYYRFDRQGVVKQVENFRCLLEAAGRLQDISAEQFLRWFDLMGVQRHLKCAGIFSRLNIRDGKPGYIVDIPLLVAYLTECCAIYPELEAFGDWLTTEVVPVLPTADNPVGFPGAGT